MSRLKILVDNPCELYLDFEKQGNAEPGKLFYIDNLNGTYTLELKRYGETLWAEDCDILNEDKSLLLSIPKEIIIYYIQQVIIKFLIENLVQIKLLHILLIKLKKKVKLY